MPTFVLSDDAEADIAGITAHIASRNLAAAVSALKVRARCWLKIRDWVKYEKASVFLGEDHLP